MCALLPAWKRTTKEWIIVKVAEQLVEQLFDDIAPKKEVRPNWFGACWLRAITTAIARTP